MKFLIPFLIAYLGSKLIFSFFGFKYDVFSEPFDLIKLSIDLAVFIALFTLAEWVFGHFTKIQQSKNIARK